MYIGIIGSIGSGKDTVGNYLVEHNGFIKESFAGTLKDVCASVFSWPRHLLEGDTEESREWRDTVDEWWSHNLKIVSFTPRLALQLIGTEVFRAHFNDAIWQKSLEYRMHGVHAGKDVVITDCRFKNEIDMIKSNDGLIIFVDDGYVPEWKDIAIKANNHCETSKVIMESEYSHVHKSEWGWLGIEYDHLILNDYDVRDDSSMQSLYGDIEHLIAKW